MRIRVDVAGEFPTEPLVQDPQATTLICFSHLRWNFVFQRPQHLMCRFSRNMDVIFFEEPIEIEAHETAYLRVSKAQDSPNVRVAVPHLPRGIPGDAREAALGRLLDAHLESRRGTLIAWYYTPMMLPFSRHVEADATVYDAMDELSKFKFAPAQLLRLEQELLGKADIVFTGGSSLYEAKKDRHSNIHCFPSSVDRVHFLNARSRQSEPADQGDLPKPRFGFYGVIDERFDADLLDEIAAIRPNWSFVMVGPIVKISTDELPKRPNIHYLGAKTYAELPSYLSGWDVALMPFALNESTQFISPTKTPEYLAGGRPVVSTPVRDVVRHYGQLESVKIASGARDFVAACEEALELARQPESDWLAEADLALSATSWDTTQARMAGLIKEVLRANTDANLPAILVAAE